MATRTQEDYADMVNPYVRAEEEAEERGFRRGIGAGIFGTVMVLSAAGALLLYRLEARAAPRPVSQWYFEEAGKPLKASQRTASITVCHNNAVRFPWHCFSVL